MLVLMHQNMKKVIQSIILDTSPIYEINYPGLKPWRPDEGWADSDVV
jgi:hypothetical protein